MWNSSTRGAPLLLLHGIGHRWQAWEPVLETLADHHDVIAVDLPGFGKSPATAGRRDIDSAISDLAEAFATFGLESPHVAGNSLGGVLALELASRDLVRSATAFAPAGFWTPRERATAVRKLKAMRRGTRLPQSVIERTMRSPRLRVLATGLIYARPSALSVERLVGDALAMRDAPSFDAVIDEGRGYVFASSPPTVPTTIAWGSKDRILPPRQAGRAARLLPDAWHVALWGSGHVPMSDDPHAVCRAILHTCAEADREGSLLTSTAT